MRNLAHALVEASRLRARARMAEAYGEKAAAEGLRAKADALLKSAWDGEICRHPWLQREASV